jgi:hypothetical protein
MVLKNLVEKIISKFYPESQISQYEEWEQYSLNEVNEFVKKQPTVYLVLKTPNIELNQDKMIKELGLFTNIEFSIDLIFTANLKN